MFESRFSTTFYYLLQSKEDFKILDSFRKALNKVQYTVHFMLDYSLEFLTHAKSLCAQYQVRKMKLPLDRKIRELVVHTACSKRRRLYLFNYGSGWLWECTSIVKYRNKVHIIILHCVGSTKMSMGQMGRHGGDTEQHFPVTFVQSWFSCASIMGCERVAGHYGPLIKSSV